MDRERVKMNQEHQENVPSPHHVTAFRRVLVVRTRRCSDIHYELSGLHYSVVFDFVARHPGHFVGRHSFLQGLVNGLKHSHVASRPGSMDK